LRICFNNKPREAEPQGGPQTSPGLGGAAGTPGPGGDFQGGFRGRGQFGPGGPAPPRLGPGAKNGGPFFRFCPEVVKPGGGNSHFRRKACLFSPAPKGSHVCVVGLIPTPLGAKNGKRRGAEPGGPGKGRKKKRGGPRSCSEWFLTAGFCTTSPIGGNGGARGGRGAPRVKFFGVPRGEGRRGGGAGLGGSPQGPKGGGGPVGCVLGVPKQNSYEKKNRFAWLLSPGFLVNGPSGGRKKKIGIAVKLLRGKAVKKKPMGGGLSVQKRGRAGPVRALFGFVIITPGGRYRGAQGFFFQAWEKRRKSGEESNSGWRVGVATGKGARHFHFLRTGGPGEFRPGANTVSPGKNWKTGDPRGGGKQPWRFCPTETQKPRNKPGGRTGAQKS